MENSADGTGRNVEDVNTVLGHHKRMSKESKLKAWDGIWDNGNMPPTYEGWTDGRMIPETQISLWMTQLWDGQR